MRLKRSWQRCNFSKFCHETNYILFGTFSGAVGARFGFEVCVHRRMKTSFAAAVLAALAFASLASAKSYDTKFAGYRYASTSHRCGQT